MANQDLPPGIKTAIEFNTYQVPNELGIEMPAQAASCVLGISVEQFEAYTAKIAADLDEDAQEMLAEPGMAAALDRLDLAPGSLMMAIGDSVTTYRRSYADLLYALLGMRRPGDDLRFMNHAQSGYTSTHARRLTYMQYIKERPDLVLILLGGNDCERFGGEQAKMLVSLDEYRQNMDCIVRAYRNNTSARLVLMSPVPVIERMLRRVPDFARSQLTWHNVDLQACANVLRTLSYEYRLPYVDLMSAFGAEPDPALYFADGLHPGPAGEKLILRAVLEALGQSNH